MRRLVIVAGLAIGLPPVLVALLGLGVSFGVSSTLALAVGAAAVWWLPARVPGALADLLANRIVLVVWLAAVVGAGVQTARLTHFMVDPARADQSILPGREFFRLHSCLSAYVEAARLAPSGVNVFDPAQYVDTLGPNQFRSHYIGPFEVDLYQYPPGFLLLPRAATAAGLDFFATRRVWFGLQVLTLLASMVGLGAWIGGRQGAVAILAIPFVWVLPPTLLSLQIGNFQATAFALAVGAMLAFERGWMAGGAAALGFATISKIFPGVLGLLLVGLRRWRPVLWTAALSLALTVTALVTVGWTPFADFVSYQMPRIESGEAFFWIELNPEFAVINQSIYGLVTKLRLLGVPWTDAAWARGISSLYALLLVPLAYVASQRVARLGASSRPLASRRLRQAQIWIALVWMASLRSPFVPDAYGLLGALWLLTLMAAEPGRTPRSIAGLGLLGLAFAIVLDGGLVPAPAPVWMVAGVLLIQLLAIAVTLRAIVRPADHPDLD